MRLLCFRGRSSSALRVLLLCMFAFAIDFEVVHGFATAGDLEHNVQPLSLQDKRIEDLEHQVHELQVSLRRGQSSPVSLSLDGSSEAPASGVQQTSAHIYNMADPAAVVAPPKYPTVKVTGFFQADWGWVNQDGNNLRTVGDVQDGADFRRARLAATGDVWDNVGYYLEMDFAFPGRPSFMDVWLEIRDLDCFQNVRVGQYRQPIGMDGQTSVRELTFIERSLPFAFLPFRQIGVMSYGHADDGSNTWAVSMFRFPTDFFGGNIGDNGGYAMASRFTFLPIYEEGKYLFHLGAAYSIGDPANDAVRYQSAPEFFVSETGGAAFVPPTVPVSTPPFVDTGVINTNMFNLFGAEAGAEYGSFYVQSEALASVVSQIGGPHVVFWGAYAQAAYLLTGEVRPYNKNNGVFGRIKPNCPFGHEGCGAWEAAVRWSYLDLDSKNIQGGRLTDLTGGINWYLNQYTKFQFNYVHAFLDRAPRGESDADIVAVRAQLDF